MRQLFKEHGLFIFILLLCAVLRFIPFFQYQFTLDELSGLSRTTFHSFSDLIEKGVKTTDTHPALIQILIFCLAKLFGYANWVIKLPFLLMGFGAIVYAYVFGLRNFSKQSGIFAAIILSFSLIFVFYAPIARMYIAGLFFSMALLFYFFEIFFREQNKISNYVLLGLFALLSALNQHLNALFALTVCASGLLFLNKTNFKAYLVTCVAVVLCYLPHLSVTLYQLAIGGIGFGQGGWLPPPENNALITFIKVVLGTGKTYVLFVALIALSVVMNRRFAFNKKQLFLLVIFLVNFCIIFFYSVFRAPVFQNSVMLFSATAFVMLVASLMHYRSHVVFMGAAAILALMLIYKTYYKKKYYQQAVKTVFEYQFERTAYYKQLYGDKAVYPVFFDADEFMKDMYFKKYGSFACKVSGDSATRFTKYYTRFVNGLSADYLVLSSSLPAQQAIAQQYFPYLIENTQTQGINYKVFSKRPGDKDHVVKPDSVIKSSNPWRIGDFAYHQMKNVTRQAGDGMYLYVQPKSKYPFEAKAKYSDFIASEGQAILFKSTYMLLPGKNADRITACIFVRAEATKINFSYTSKQASDFVIRPDSTVTMYVDNVIGTVHRNTLNNSKIKVYPWNRGRNHFVLTDFQVELIDYWPQKWHFWD